MAIVELRGNIFFSKADAICNTCNCVGPMGRGIALEFKQLYPDMYQKYREKCSAGVLRPGIVLPYTGLRRKGIGPVIFNLMVKDHWRNASDHAWVHTCCEKLAANYARFSVSSLALPHIGRLNGWIDWPTSHAIIHEVLGDLPIRVELIEYDPQVRTNVAVPATPEEVL